MAARSTAAAAAQQTPRSRLQPSGAGKASRLLEPDAASRLTSAGESGPVLPALPVKAAPAAPPAATGLNSPQVIAPPSLTISTSSQALTTGQKATVTFQFSQDPGRSFSRSSVEVSGGKLGPLSGSGLIRTAAFTPQKGILGTATLQVAAGAYSDAAGTPGLAASAPPISFDTRRFGIASSTLVDLLADRIPDLAVGSTPGSTSTVLVVATDSGATLQTWLPFGNTDLSGVRVESGDVNADGFDDLVAVRLRPGKDRDNDNDKDNGTAPGCEVAVLLGASPSSTQPPVTLSFTAFNGQARGPLALAVRDVDLDGYADVVLSDTRSERKRSAVALEVWSAASGGFQRSTGLSLPSTAALDPTHGYDVALGDLDGNGSVELVLGDLDGGDLFVGSIAPGGSPTAGAAIAPTVLNPYGPAFRKGVKPTVVSAQQTLVQRPPGLDATALPWSVGGTSGVNQALLAGLGTPGALIVQSAEERKSNPVQVPLSWLSGGTAASNPLVAIPWTAGTAPVFSSGGVSFLNPGGSQNNPVLLQGAPQPILLAAAAGSTGIQLLSGPTSSGSGSWQPISSSANTISATAPTTQPGWINAWSTANSSGINTGDPTESRELYNQVSTELVSYTPPYTINLNPLNLANPGQLLSDLQGHLNAYVTDVVQPWNSQYLDKTTATAWGPGVPGSSNDPYGNANPNPNPSLPLFTPSFSPELSPGGVAATTNLTEQFQQRLISTALASMAINYQHHYSPTWYGPQTWTPQQTPTPQLSWLTAPEGRQTQGLDCSNFSSWNYNMAFGFWLDSSPPTQATQTTVNVDWLTGTSKTITSTQIATSPADVYLVNPSDPANSAIRGRDQVIAYLNSILQPGDLLYIAGKSVIDDPTATTLPEVKHVITWMNNNSSSDPLPFVGLNNPGSGYSNPAFIIDSTGSESTNILGQAYPNGVAIRQFDQTAWYVTNIVSINRWLTPTNVQTLAASLPGVS